MGRNLPPKEDWLPDEPERLVALVGWLGQQVYDRKVDIDAQREHLKAAQEKLKRAQ